jgi:eukaryotic-like serine/threonine-protein kinase
MEDLHASDPRIIGPYRILKRIGTGGMGVVYLAEEGKGRQVALKLLRPELADDSGFRTRFRREVEAGRRVGGISTARYLDADLDSDHPYLTTEFVAGGNLHDYVTSHGPLAGDQLIALAVGLAEALVALANVGVVHRDLKPSNVLMGPSGPKVVDFGISRAADETVLTQTGGLIGSPGWMAPEQALGRPTTAAIDVFSWGATVAFASTGRSPFGVGRPDALLFRAVHENPDLEGVEPRLRPLIERSLSKDPNNRPAPDRLLLDVIKTPTGRSVAAGIPEAMTTQVLDHPWHQESNVVAPHSAPRRRVHFGWIAAAVLVLLAGGVGIGVGYASRSSNSSSPPKSTDIVTHSTTTTTHRTLAPPSTAAGQTTVPSTVATTLPSDATAVFDFNAASQTVNQLGYNVVTPPNSQDPAPDALNVLIGQCDGSADGYCENAFFFVGSKYIGTDISSKDAAVSIAWQNDTTVALSYPLYARGDPLCCPTDGVRLVRFSWDGQSLSPLDPLPANPNQESSH